MKNIMLRATSAVLGTTAILLVALAAVVVTSGTSFADDPIPNPFPIPVCPAEPQNGKCEGICKEKNWVCTPGTRIFPDGTERDICGCLPPDTAPD